jgi:hypothetical protein
MESCWLRRTERPWRFEDGFVPKKEKASSTNGTGLHKIRRRATLPRPETAVPLPLRPFTSVFGMGTGVTSSLWSPEKSLNIDKEHFACSSGRPQKRMTPSDEHEKKK